MHIIVRFLDTQSFEARSSSLGAIAANPLAPACARGVKPGDGAEPGARHHTLLTHSVSRPNSSS